MKKSAFNIFLFCFITVTGAGAQTPFPAKGKVFNDEILPRIYVTIDPEELDELYATREAATGIKQLTMPDLVGREVLNSSVDSAAESLDVTKLLPGIYLLLVHFENGRVATNNVVKR